MKKLQIKLKAEGEKNKALKDQLVKKDQEILKLKNQ